MNVADPEGKQARHELVLETRLDVLRANLGRVAQVVEATRSRGAELRKVRRMIDEEVGNLVKRLRAHVLSVPNFLDVDGDRVRADVEAAGQLVVQLEGALNSCRADLEQMRSRQELELQPGWQHSLKGRLVNQAESSRTAVDRLRRRLGEDPGERDLVEVWRDYSQLLQGEGCDLFGDYVEVLRGLAMREAGLDSGICRLADPLLLTRLDRFPGFQWNSLTVPGFRGPASTPSARLVRLGFPEWTIWALPLAAQTFGRIVVDELDDLRQTVVEPLAAGLDAAQVAHLEVCLADAIAAWTIGPAYACAAVLMQFDPLPGEAGAPADDDRARMIFEVWRRVQEDAGQYTFGADLRQRLGEEWTAAVEQAGEQPAGGGAAAAERVAGWAEPVCDWLKANARDAAYPVTAWEEKAYEWSRKLLAEEEVEPRDTDLRDVLNAAWACRVEHPGRVDEIEQAAHDLWHRMIDRVSSTGGRAVVAQRGPYERVEQPERPKGGR